KEHIDKVFERFYKVPNLNTDDSGSGLGLSMCKTIVSKEGGEIKLTSSAGKGSIFCITIPMVKDGHDNN
ncbi:MAG: ATP-binding protein, partial [Dehalococcoidales bacterium]|nr:ATP-binding protein [Dehalococcoidales bacterium]